ncbi:MAG: DUF11 domain-containing protein, partial [Planctomycetes bacterium]|nr:DUF11 domain-containing protein [Planctomycetota bacterium]
VQWVKLDRLHVGRECAFELIVRNNGKVTAADVSVDAYFPSTVRLTKATPQPIEKPDYLSWSFASLDPGEEKIIKIGLIPSQRGQLETRAFVRYTGASEGVFIVEEPLLKLTMSGPQEVMVGDPASQTILISNPGTGIATNVSVEAIIPVGLEHPRGERLVMEIGDLNPGESRSVRLALAAASGGQQTIQVRATADDNLRRILTSDIYVIAPNIEIDIDGPTLRYLGRKAAYILDVSNDGSAPSNNVRVTHYVPEGFDYVDSDHGGKYDKTKRSVSWFVGRLEPDQNVQLKCVLKPNKLGRFEQHVVAISEQGIKSEATYTTDVDGTSSLVLEIVDLDDPVEVGTETAYEIRVRNEGTKAGKNIEITCDLPAGVELIAAKGPTGALVRNGQVVFKSLPRLDPNKTAIYRIHVIGKVEGNHRFRAQMASDSIQKPLIFEELTKFYAD